MNKDRFVKLRFALGFFVLAAIGVRVFAANESPEGTCVSGSDGVTCADCIIYFDLVLASPKCYAYSCDSTPLASLVCVDDAGGDGCTVSGISYPLDCDNCMSWECSVTTSGVDRTCETTHSGQGCRCPEEISGSNEDNPERRQICT